MTLVNPTIVRSMFSIDCGVLVQAVRGVCRRNAVLRRRRAIADRIIGVHVIVWMGLCSCRSDEFGTAVVEPLASGDE